MAGHINEELAKRHAYTPKHMLSPSTICKLVKELTSGRIMSRAGLDNIDVEKEWKILALCGRLLKR